MHILFFISLVFSEIVIVDSCTDEFCNFRAVKNGVYVVSTRGIPNSYKSTFLNTFHLTGNSHTLEFINGDSDKSILEKEALGKKAREVSKRILDLIAGHNLGLSLTTPQIQTLKVTYAAAKECLDDNQPWCAKAEIAKITPDGVIVTQELLDQVNTIFSESGLPNL